MRLSNLGAKSKRDLYHFIELPELYAVHQLILKYNFATVTNNPAACVLNDSPEEAPLFFFLNDSFKGAPNFFFS